MTPPNTLAEAIDNIKDMSGTYCHLNAKDIRDVQTILKAARSTLTRPTISGELSSVCLIMAKDICSFFDKESPVTIEKVAQYILNCSTKGGLHEAIGRNPITAKRTGKPEGAIFDIGDRVFKTRGSCWEGRIVGFYSTELTPVGYAVESQTETGSVQIYPEQALDHLQAIRPDLFGGKE